MSDSRSLLSRVRELIESGGTLDGLTQLRKFLDDGGTDALRDEAVLLLSRLHRLQSNQRAGTIDSDQANAQRARIDLSALQFLDEIAIKLPAAPPARPTAVPTDAPENVGAPASEFSWDLFISHASEDKEGVVLPLAAELVNRRLRVWVDQAQLTLGDSLRRKLDDGLATSRFGVVVLSRSFFAKEWPQRELDGLSSRESGGRKVILPVRHDISQAEVARHSPLLAGRLSVSTDRGLPFVADEIVRAWRGV